MKTPIIFVGLVLAAIIGWGSNVYKLTQCDFASPYKCEALRIVGIIPPIGAVMGYVDIEDGTSETK